MSSSFVRIGRYVLDVSLNEDHRFESDVTSYPVESGGSISDNIRPKPAHISITGIVTDTPLASNAANKPMLVGDPYFPGVDAFISDVNAQLNTIQFLRSEEAYGYLKFIWQSRDTVTVRTSLGTFDNMALTSLVIPRSKETHGALHFTAEFEQIESIENTNIKVSVQNGSGKNNRGSRSAKDRYLVNTVNWRKADPAGSPNIYATELVRWYWKPSDPIAKGYAWYHWPSAIPLSRIEVFQLNKDLARDRNDRKLFGESGFNEGLTATTVNGVVVPTRPTRAGANLSTMSRDSAKNAPLAPTLENGAGPTFQNPGNFTDAAPVPTGKPLAKDKTYIDPKSYPFKRRKLTK